VPDIAMNEPETFPGTISDLETDLEDALIALVEYERRGELPPELRPLLALTPPEGASVHVSLRHRESLRQIRRTLDEKCFDARTCGAWIVFELAPADTERRDHDETGDYMREFVLALDRAERDPHMSFVALKFFRDQYLAKTGHGWARDFDLVRHVMQQATEGQLISLSKVPNPRQPEFPVTSIHLNREHPTVVEWLGPRAVLTGRDNGTPPEEATV
jgi:hypothetical protein